MERFFLFSLFFYILSALLAIGSNRAESKLSLPISKYTYFVGTIIASAIFFGRLYQHETWVIFDFFGGILFSLMIIGMVYLFSQRKTDVPFAPAVLSIVSTFLGIAGLTKMAFTGQAELTGVKSLAGHTYFMFIALASFTFSFIFSTLFLIQENLIKHKVIGKLFFKLPPLEMTSRFNFIAVTIGTASLFAGLVGGWIHLYRVTTEWSFFLEPSLILSVVILLFYVVIVMLKLGPLERARSVSFASLICYILLLFVFIGAH